CLPRINGTAVPPNGIEQFPRRNSPHGVPPHTEREPDPMRGKRFGTGVSLAAGALAVCGLVFAPSAAAVAPGSATVNADCGSWGGGDATLTATQSGTSATITINTTAVTAPLSISKDSLVSELTMVKAGGGT